VAFEILWTSVEEEDLGVTYTFICDDGLLRSIKFSDGVRSHFTYQPTWTTADSTKLKVSDMTIRHRQNCMRILKRILVEDESVSKTTAYNKCLLRAMERLNSNTYELDIFEDFSKYIPSEAFQQSESEYVPNFDLDYYSFFS